MNQVGKSARVSRSDENKGKGAEGGGRWRVGVTVTESDTRPQPKLIACPLKSAANVSRHRHRAAANRPCSPPEPSKITAAVYSLQM